MLLGRLGGRYLHPSCTSSGSLGTSSKTVPPSLHRCSAARRCPDAPSGVFHLRSCSSFSSLFCVGSRLRTFLLSSIFPFTSSTGSTRSSLYLETQALNNIPRGIVQQSRTILDALGRGKQGKHTRRTDQVTNPTSPWNDYCHGRIVGRNPLSRRTNRNHQASDVE